jgi:acid stress-induced BolA-like protein IbaG/YrbA
MEPDKIRTLIEEALPGAHVTVTGDGRHFDALVVSEAFAGKTLIQRHRLVLDAVHDRIASDELHAISIKAKTPGEVGG